MPNPIKKKKHQIQPAPQLLEKIGATNLMPADAIAEIVANSFDSSVDGQNTEVEVLTSPEQIVVIDNCAGMTEDVLAEALRLGVDMQDVLKRTDQSKGKFGLGMKTACAALGRWWSVQTRPIGANKEFRVAFDLADWERKKDSTDPWSIEIEEYKPDTNGPLGDRDHGTAIIVKRLRRKDSLSGAVLSKLGESFKPHIESGDVIQVNGDAAVPHQYRFVPNSQVPIDIRFGPRNEFKISGWVAIDHQTHNDGRFGFNIYRRKQLVQSWNQDWFRSHLMTSRIIGQVDMDFIDATFFKQGLQQNELWHTASVKMKEFMKPVVAAADALGREKNIRKPAKRNEIINRMHSDLGLPIPEVVPDQVDNNDLGEGEANGSKDRSREDFPKLQIEPEELVLETGTRILISRIERGMGADGPPFDYLDDGDPVNLQTVINSEHPMFENTRDKDQLRRLAIADSILRYLVEKCGTDMKVAARIRNAWILTPALKAEEVAL